jgi:hypothetical protein
MWALDIASQNLLRFEHTVKESPKAEHYFEYAAFTLVVGNEGDEDNWSFDGSSRLACQQPR